MRRDLALRLYHLIDIQIRMLELRMKTDLEAHQQALEAGEPAPPIKDERETFAALIEQINQVTEMASEPASAAHGRRKPAINPELTALSDEIDAAALAAASEKDDLRSTTCGASCKGCWPEPDGLDFLAAHLTREQLRPHDP